MSVGAEPDVLKAEHVPSLKWQPADEEGLVAFLVGEKNFNEDRVRKQIQKMAATKGKSAQGTIDLNYRHLHAMLWLGVHAV